MYDVSLIEHFTSVTLGLGYFAGNSLSILKRGFSRVDHILILAITLVIMGLLLIGFFKYRRREKKLSGKDQG